MDIYIVVETNGYVATVATITLDQDLALKNAKTDTEDWGVHQVNEEETGDSSCIYFTQKQDGDMSDSVAVFKLNFDNEVLKLLYGQKPSPIEEARMWFNYTGEKGLSIKAATDAMGAKYVNVWKMMHGLKMPVPYQKKADKGKFSAEKIYGDYMDHSAQLAKVLASTVPRSTEDPKEA
jgi:hypothetical protein